MEKKRGHKELDKRCWERETEWDGLKEISLLCLSIPECEKRSLNNAKKAHSPSCSIYDQVSFILVMKMPAPESIWQAVFLCEPHRAGLSIYHNNFFISFCCFLVGCMHIDMVLLNCMMG